MSQSSGMRSRALNTWRPASDLAEELRYVTEHDVEIADEWFMIDAGWLRRWSRYVRKSGEHPGPISNHLLVDLHHHFSKPKEGLKVGVHYRGVCSDVWHRLWHSYGGGPVIKGDKGWETLDIATAVVTELPQWHDGPEMPRQGGRKISRQWSRSTTSTFITTKTTSTQSSSASESRAVAAPQFGGSSSSGKQKESTLSKLKRSLAMCGGSSKKCAEPCTTTTTKQGEEARLEVVKPSPTFAEEEEEAACSECIQFGEDKGGDYCESDDEADCDDNDLAVAARQALAKKVLRSRSILI
mmetsp:Transcript_15709/g.36858  ORF Transcript_15709/g.36858 Transcript_15709/m.36858 type:complete len:297 (-) Transcript_15709:457-1347(-)